MDFVLEVCLFVFICVVEGGWCYFQGLLLCTLAVSLPAAEELCRLRALDALDWELLVDMRLDMRPMVNIHANNTDG